VGVPGGRAYRIFNGSACTSSSYTPSHVIKAMGYSDDEANEAIRLSCCHLTPGVDWDGLLGAVGVTMRPSRFLIRQKCESIVWKGSQQGAQQICKTYLPSRRWYKQ